MPNKFLPTLRFAALLGLATLAAVSSAQAVSLEPSSVVPSDTFSFEIFGYNSGYQSQGIYLTTSTNFQPTFGTPTSYGGGALGGQTLTVQSFEFVNSGVQYDLINISVPTNFVPVGTKDSGGHVIDTIQFSIGNYATTNGNTLDFSQPLGAFMAKGSLSYTLNGTSASDVVPMMTVLTNGNRSLTSYGSEVATPLGTGDIANNQITSFSFVVSYAVPEPSTYATVALGVGGLFLVIRRRRARL